MHSATLLKNTTNRVFVIPSVSTPLEVFTNGPGRISPLYAGQMLDVWQTYNMVATPDPGAAFYNWEYVDVFIRTTRVTNDSGGVITNVQKTVTSKNQVFISPEWIFSRPIYAAMQGSRGARVGARAP